jgi:hypothetical protein
LGSAADEVRNGSRRETRGLDPLVALAWQAHPLTVVDVERAMGAPLSELARDWRAWALARYHAAEDAEAEAERFRTQTPIAHFPVCPPDVLGAP